MDKTLCILKDSKQLNIDNDVIYPNTFYRCIEGDKKDIYVYGYNMPINEFDKNFEFAYERIMRDWERIGLVKNGKPISKTAFKALANVHTYGKQTNNDRIIFFGIPNECLYGFYPLYNENKAKQLNAMYEWYIQTIEGYTGYFDGRRIQFGRNGVPVCYGNLR